MSIVKIKPAATAAATAAAVTEVDVKVKLEPSLSTVDIKLEQHTPDIDTKVESDTEADNEEGEDDIIKSENDDVDEDDNEDSDQNQFTITPRKQQRITCKHSGCGCSFSNTGNLRIHQHEHMLQTKLGALGMTYTLTRQSLDDRWPCPIPNCTSTLKTVKTTGDHIRTYHDITIRQQQQQQSPAQIAQRSNYFQNVDDFYANGVRCGYHNTVGVFICYECRSVPECLLTHLQLKHGYDEKSIDNAILPDSAVNANDDPNVNQHTGNPHLAAAIRTPHWQQHQDIVQGWLCITSDCGYCGYTYRNKEYHKRNMHHGEELLTTSALMLRLILSKTQTTCFLITRIDQVTTRSNKMNRHKLDYSHNGLDSHDENEDDDSQNEITETLGQKRQWKCEYPDCELVFNTAKLLYMHRREHLREVVINVHGNTFTLTRQSLDDRWACPVPDCVKGYQIIHTIHTHILRVHSASLRQKRAKSEDEDNQQQQQQQVTKKRQPTIYYLNVVDFYVSGTRCGYHNPTRLFICYACRLVPECLLTHLQQKHGFDEKSIDNSVLSNSARIGRSDPNGNQHTSNPHLAAAISKPTQPQHPDIVKGWLCVTSNCGHCGYTVGAKNRHKKSVHKGEQRTIVPALVLRLLFGKIRTSGFLITRLDTTNNSSVKPTDSASQYDNKCEDDDGDELVLSDYSD